MTPHELNRSTDFKSGASTNSATLPKEFVDVVEEKNIVGQIKPFHAGETLQWQIEGIVN